MDKTVGTVTVTQEAILDGTHHIITNGLLADDIEDLKAGMPLYNGGSGYEPVPEGYTTEKPTAILLNDVKGPTADDAEPIAIHGKIRAEKVFYADGETPADETLATDLRAVGIYLVGAFAPAP
jgi:hypothetical protein